ncbi:MAG: cation:proton antiporter [Saprospiraceae bacterium]
MEQFGSYPLIIAASLIIIASFLFNEISKRTNIPSVLMLIVLGVVLKVSFADKIAGVDFSYLLELLGIVGLIMIVLEAALELKLTRDQLIPIAKAMLIAAAGLMLSAWVCAELLMFFVDGMTSESAWLYATPLSILSSAIIIPSVGSLRKDKKEFHIYESTFSDILGIILFYFLTGPFEAAEKGGVAHNWIEYSGILVLTVVLALIGSYILVLVFQKLKSHVKLFLLIAVLLLEYAIGKTYHLSSLIIILIFGLMFANVNLFFFGPMKKLIQPKKIAEIFEGLHIVTLETAFVVRTFFFVIFGLTIDPSSLLSFDVMKISVLIIASIYIIRFVLLRVFVGKDLVPQLFIAPRGLITVLLYNAIPAAALIAGFQPGILLFVIIGTSLIMTFSMIQDKKRAGMAIRKAEESPVDLSVWSTPGIDMAKAEVDGGGH